VCIGLVVVAALVMVPRWGKPAWRRVAVLYWQHRCLAFTAPADAVTYDWDSPHVHSAADAPFQAFYRLLSPPGDRGAPVVFSHQLRTPSGSPRLVVIQAYVFSDGYTSSEDTFSLMVTFRARVFRPGGLTARPSQVLTRDTGSLVIASGRPTTINAGQPDPADPTHFTLTGISGGRAFAVDGWLQDDEAVVMDLRTGRPMAKR
jgi:hypothetical protein